MKFLHLTVKQLGALIAILIIFLGLNIGSLLLPLRETLTYDEDYHYHAGYAVLTGKAAQWGREDLSQRNVIPAMAINTLTGMYLNKIFPRIVSVPESIAGSNVVFLAKLATIFISTILAIYIFIWSRELYGLPSAFLAIGLYILEPNIIAHSRLVTQDLWGTASVFIAVYYFWKYLQCRTLRNASLSIIFFALAQVSRFTSVYLIPIYLILGLSFFKPYISKFLGKINIYAFSRGLKKLSLYMIFLIITTTLIINLGFSFERSFTPLKDYQFTSKTFTKLQENPILKSLPVPLPYAYLQGLDMGQSKQESGFGSGSSYLLGEIGFTKGKLHGFLDYYAIAFLFKVPISLQIFIFLGLSSLFFYRKELNIWQNESFLLLPVFIYSLSFSLMNAQLGIRYILMIFPFLIILAARSVLMWHEHRRRYKIFVVVLFIYLLLSNLSYFPHYISYFNELVTNRTMSYKVLADSNLDWGQNKIYLQDYMKKHPDSALVTVESGKMVLKRGEETINTDEKPIKRLIIEANQLVGITTAPEFFKWWRESKTPIDNVAYSYLVYEHNSAAEKELIRWLD
ncbi:MAG: hypothetical protein N5P05_002580 [Chroococcopsis gigantea SAG 12.99]|jgi:hypothetical protein|nr:glycosyltransferase family 39 protein [Chlorogloea purpurea SAG 13.99]MDV3000974.1 hypothetical protein [Chroococcopsis gigantea SAG 12.99]